ncbi:MAG: YcxB family protein [Bacteroidia bacterium]|nr:YcxB family protein [Bacteroidia bacterium]
MTITIRTKLNKAAFAKFLILRWYKRPIGWLYTFVGLGSLLNLIFLLNNSTKADMPLDATIIITVVTLLVMPGLTLLQAHRSFGQNSRLAETIQYSFRHDAVLITGESFNSSFDWSKLYGITEQKDWVLLRETKALFHLVDKSAFSQEQLEDFRDLVRSKLNLKLKLRH